MGRTNYSNGQRDPSVVAALDRALGTDGLRCWFQPIVDAHSHRIVALEGLVRCVDPEIGLILPSALLPAAAASGRLAEIDAWMLDRACARLGTWDRAFPELQLRVAVNLSAQLLERTSALVGLVERTLQIARLDPTRLRLELDDATMLDATPAATGALGELRSMGVSVGIDNLTTGCAALGCLGDLQVDFVSVDGALVRQSVDEVASHAVVAAIVRLAHTHGLTVIAEGVETAAQARAMADLGCDELQGFLFSRPAPGDELDAGFGSVRPTSPRTDPVLL